MQFLWITKAPQFWLYFSQVKLQPLCVFCLESRILDASNWTVQNNKRNLKKKEKLPQLPHSQVLDFAGVPSPPIIQKGFLKPDLHLQTGICTAVNATQGLGDLGLSDSKDKDLSCARQPSHAKREKNEWMDWTHKETNLRKYCQQERESHFLFVL